MDVQNLYCTVLCIWYIMRMHNIVNIVIKSLYYVMILFPRVYNNVYNYNDHIICRRVLYCPCNYTYLETG